MRKLVILVTVVSIALFLAACSTAPAEPAKPAEPATPPPAAKPAEPAPSGAAQLFAINCSGCHGQTRQGVTGLAPALTPTSLAAKTVDELKTTITKGRTGTAMPAFEGRLKAEEINSLADFVKNVAP